MRPTSDEACAKARQTFCQRQLAMGGEADGKRIDDGEGPDLRGREHSATDGEHQRDREHDRPFRVPGRTGQCADRGLGAVGDHVAAPLRDRVSRDHQHHHHQQAGDDACHEQPADRDVADIAVEDQADRGRNGRRDQRADGDGGGRIALAVALGDHRRAQDARLHGRVRDGRAGHAAHQGGEQDRDLRQAARDPADRHHRDLQQAVGDAALVHEMAGEHEERHGEQRETLAHRGDLLHADGQRHGAIDDEEDEAGNAGGEGHRHAHHHEHHEHDGDQQHV